VQQCLQGFGVEHEVGACGAPGLGVHRRESPGVKGVDGMAHVLGGTAQLLGNVRGALPTRTGQQDLDRRRVKASEERSPVSSCWRSSEVIGRTYIGGLMSHTIPPHASLHKIYREPALSTPTKVLTNAGILIV
jgi:hypothetical protein